MNPPNPATAEQGSSQAGPSPTARSSAFPVSRAEFTRTFDRCFDRVYVYVERRIRDRDLCERVVREVLEANLQVLVDGADDRGSLCALKLSSDERIEAARAAKSAPGFASRP